MPIKILMPALSPTMTEGTIAKWLKKEGDNILAGEVIAEIETDKATMEVEAVNEGTLAKIIIAEGTEGVLVNSLIAVLTEEEEEESDINEFISTIIDKTITATSDVITNNVLKKENEVKILSIEKPANTKTFHITKINSDNIESLNDNNASRIFVSPLAKRMAIERGIALIDIIGSGPRGRIVKSDVLLAENNKAEIQSALQEYKLVPNSNMRKIIAKRLMESKLTIPHFYLSIECIMDGVLTMRQQVNANLTGNNQKLSVNDFIILAAAKALREVPEINASWTDQAIIMYNNIDISVAVAIDGGLITPIIKNTDRKSITKISTEMKDLAKRAKENSLLPEEFQGGGFTISNLGMYGIKSFSAIVNPPQSCIMAVGMSIKKPIVIDDKIEIKTITDITISCDHRVVNGAIGAQFLATFKKYIEIPVLMLV